MKLNEILFLGCSLLSSKEDNKKSVCTDTRETWSQKKLSYEDVNDDYVTYYKYTSKYPHAGAGQRVQF